MRHNEQWFGKICSSSGRRWRMWAAISHPIRQVSEWSHRRDGATRPWKPTAKCSSSAAIKVIIEATIMRIGRMTVLLEVGAITWFQLTHSRLWVDSCLQSMHMTLADRTTTWAIQLWDHLEVEEERRRVRPIRDSQLRLNLPQVQVLMLFNLLVRNQDMKHQTATTFKAHLINLNSKLSLMLTTL